MSKKFKFKSTEEVRNKPTEQLTHKSVEDAMDAWVTGKSEKIDLSPTSTEEPTKRISISINDSLHRKIKQHCVHEGISIKDKIINLLIADMRL